jgi:ribosomal protein S18 acetylase RimI-like enzyme
MNTQPSILAASTYQFLAGLFKGQTEEAWLEHLRAVYAQLSDDPTRPMNKMSADLFRHFFGWKGVLFLAMHEGKVVGMVTLAPVPDIDSFGGYVDNLVVDQAYNGRGLEKMLMDELIARAKTRNMEWLVSPSRWPRAETEELYLYLGFRKRKADTFELDLVTSGA